MIDGLVVVDKPNGWTSHDVVAKLRGVYGQKRLGHAGTLDPAATGVLVVGLGRVTRLLRFFLDSRKLYRGEIAFGVATDTLDAGGNVLERQPMPVEQALVESVVERFTGEIEQLPPMVSAVKVRGQRLYEAARKGEHVDREPRRVHVYRFEVEAFEPGPFPLARVLVECSSGTYVRTLAADLGTALGGCAHLASLRRLSVGPFTLDDAHEITEIEADPNGVVLDPAKAMAHLERVEVDDDTARAVVNGVVFPAPMLLGEDAGSGPFAVLDFGGKLLAVYERRGSACKPVVVIG